MLVLTELAGYLPSKAWSRPFSLDTQYCGWHGRERCGRGHAQELRGYTAGVWNMLSKETLPLKHWIITCICHILQKSAINAWESRCLLINRGFSGLYEYTPTAQAVDVYSLTCLIFTVEEVYVYSGSRTHPLGPGCIFHFVFMLQPSANVGAQY